ncbi:MAG TPA: RNA polymerase sigma factor [Thermoanaerobaculia bacterium]|nr:RNA polymerase sigma factor [Thermoanaerobaculia bacterium]
MTAIPDSLSRDAMTDAEIVRRVLEGETALFELIMRRYNQRVYRAVRAIVRDESETEDVMQQAYVNAYTHLRQFEQRSAFSTWLTRIAINEALARIRPRGLHMVPDADMPEVESPSPNPEEAAMTSEIKEVMESEISALPDSYRSVFMLREVEGLSTIETAECLNLSEDVVKTRLHRARAMLRENIYKRANFGSTFTFGHGRCDRIVAAVMARIA